MEQMNPIYSSEGLFWNLMNFFTQNAPKGCTPDFLYHYTKPEVLPHICKQHGRLLATNVAYFEDHDEIFYGAMRFLDILARDGAWPQSDVSEYRQKLLSLQQATNFLLPWVASLSCRKDSPRMWHDYTSREGGYCVVFRYKGLEKFLEWAMSRRLSQGEADTGSLFIMPCVYEGKHDIGRCLRAYYHDFSAVLSDRSNTNLVLAHLIIADALIKKTRYQYEHEWRIILVPPLHRLGQFEIEWCNNKPRLSLGLEKWIDDFRRLIAGIQVSPHGQHQKLCALAKKLVRDFRSVKGDRRVKIEISGLPTDFDMLENHCDKSQQAYESHA